MQWVLWVHSHYGTDLPLNNSDAQGLENVPQQVNGTDAAVAKDYGHVEGTYGGNSTMPELNADNLIETLLSLVCGLCKSGTDADDTPGRGGTANAGNAANLPLIEQDIVTATEDPGEIIHNIDST